MTGLDPGPYGVYPAPLDGTVGDLVYCFPTGGVLNCEQCKIGFLQLAAGGRGLRFQKARRSGLTSSTCAVRRDIGDIAL